MARKILRSEAPQNDSGGGAPRLRTTASLPCHSEPIPPCHSERSEESSLPAQRHGTKDSSSLSLLRMTGRGGGAAPQNDRSFVILSPTPPCHSERSEESILPAQRHGTKDSSSLSLLRMTARGSAAPQNDSSFVILSPTLLVILSEAKNLPSRLKGMVRKILRRFRSSE